MHLCVCFVPPPKDYGHPSFPAHLLPPSPSTLTNALTPAPFPCHTGSTFVLHLVPGQPFLLLTQAGKPGARADGTLNLHAFSHTR